jgi:hypothetical protein
LIKFFAVSTPKAFEDWPWPAFKTSRQLREICCPMGAKDLKSPVFESFEQIKKLWRYTAKTE